VDSRHGRRKRKPAALLEAVRGVLAEYDAYLPLTARQIYYRLIGLDVKAMPRTSLP